MITNQIYVCYKEGKQENEKRMVDSILRCEVRTDCKVKLNLGLEKQN